MDNQTTLSVKQYLLKRNDNEVAIQWSPPAPDTQIIIVIPSYAEENLFHTLTAITNASKPQCNVEIITILNASEEASIENKQLNENQYNKGIKWAEKQNKDYLKFYFLLKNNIPPKHAGVGYARKTGMDIALQRFLQVKTDGLIVCLDADSLCDENYLTELEIIARNPKINAFSIYFEHPIEGNDFDEKIYQSVISYELHLRYYKNALKFARHPLAIYTVGSSMGVRASVYAKQGGMNKRKAGEDFYFLNKVAALGGFHELNTTRVIPSPRISKRVPFGTGKAIADLIKTDSTTYYTYDFQSFIDLKKFFEIMEKSYRKKPEKCFPEVPKSIQNFITLPKFTSKMSEINRHSASPATFQKRFYTWWNPFTVMKYLHFARDRFYPNQPVLNEVMKLTNQSFGSEKDALIYLRNKDKVN
ncbi:MAG: glycosyltransferase family 2 protein [Bacteroidetes bacterium]|nr:MAG: glycosyltransferase family 2 protein [Bacteroidota bacterium]